MKIYKFAFYIVFTLAISGVMNTVFTNGLDLHENFDTSVLTDQTSRTGNNFNGFKFVLLQKFFLMLHSTGQAVFHQKNSCFNMFKSQNLSYSTGRQTFMNCQNMPRRFSNNYNPSLNKIQFQNFPRKCNETFENKTKENEENKNCEDIKKDKINGEIKVSPLCSINELVKYNKITSQYILIDETGPAHKKVFLV